MNRNLLALCAVAVVAAAAIAWLWLSSQSQSTSSASLPSQAASPSSNVQPAQPAAAAPVPASEPDAGTAADASERALANTELPSGPHEWIDGSVRIPSDTPGDELLEIWAFATSSDPSTKAAALSRAAVADGEGKPLAHTVPLASTG